MDQTRKETIRNIPEGLDKHQALVVGLLARSFACADKLRRDLVGAGGECGCCGVS